MDKLAAQLSLLSESTVHCIALNSFLQQSIAKFTIMLTLCILKYSDKQFKYILYVVTKGIQEFYNRKIEK